MQPSATANIQITAIAAARHRQPGDLVVKAVFYVGEVELSCTSYTDSAGNLVHSEFTQDSPAWHNLQAAIKRVARISG